MKNYSFLTEKLTAAIITTLFLFQNFDLKQYILASLCCEFLVFALFCVDFNMRVQGKVKDRMEKFVVLPFSMGCVSHSSVAVAEQRPRRSKSDFRSHSIKEEDEDILPGEGTKHSSRFLAIPRPNISTGVNRLMKGFKSLSQLFIYEDEMDELGMDMEIGCPTDVKHMIHIGWDVLANANPLMGWDSLISSELLSHPRHPTPSLKQFELATTAAPEIENDSPTFVSLNASSSLA